ncbi:MAG TPA: serine/threonine protein kinase [Candidatus Saccharimonadales bacterium]|nr:serine/threonine protein kinase [Candidatus Saccharimonadales bacterium]
MDRTEVIGGGRLVAERYQLISRIDSGGTAEVWRARDIRLGRDVAVKILGAEVDAAFRERFTDEAKRAAAVTHPNIVTVYDEGQDGDDAFIVMEHVRGKTLRDSIAARGPLPPSEAAGLVSQIGSALDATHRAGMVHCDVKPANVIVTDDGVAKLTDFGIARAARGAAERELVGTARYIAPERIEGQAPTPRSDVYSLALVAFELLAGRPAYAGVETEDLLRDRLSDQAPSIAAVRSDLPARVAPVIAQALARDPADRYASAGAFAEALSEASRGGIADRILPLARGGATGVRVLFPAGGGFRLPRFDSLIALGLVLLVLIAVALFFTRFPTAATPAAPPPAAATAAGTGGTPRVTGLKLDEAIRSLVASGYQVAWNFDAALPGPPCTVGRQDPAAGSAIARGARVALTYVPGKDCTKKVED